MILVGVVLCVFFFQAEDGIRDLVRSRGLGDVYKRQGVKGSQIVGLAKDLARSLSLVSIRVVETIPGKNLSLIHI